MSPTETLRKLFTTSRPSGAMTSTPTTTAMLQNATSRRSTVRPRVPGVMAVLSMGRPADRAPCRYTARGIRKAT